MTEFITNISKTAEGYPVKNLKWNQRDNIIVGMVKCPILGRENLHDGYVCVQWTKFGKPTNKWKGRIDLKISLF